MGGTSLELKKLSMVYWATCEFRERTCKRVQCSHKLKNHRSARSKHLATNMLLILILNILSLNRFLGLFRQQQVSILTI